ISSAFRRALGVTRMAISAPGRARGDRSGKEIRAITAFDLSFSPCQTSAKRGESDDHRLLLGRALLLAWGRQLRADPTGGRLCATSARRPAGKHQDQAAAEKSRRRLGALEGNA